MMPYTATDIVRRMTATFEPAPRRQSSLQRFVSAVHSRFFR
jgi:hypothetical protein